LSDAVATAGIAVQTGCAIAEATPSADRTEVAGVEICRLDSRGRLDGARRETVECDGVVVAVGWMPNVSLACQAGIPFTYCRDLEQMVPGTVGEGLGVVGRMNGVHDLESRMEDGTLGGAQAAAFTGNDAGEIRTRSRPQGPPFSHPYPIVEHPGGKNFVDFDEDLHLADFRNAHGEGFDSIELMKRYSTVGMGPSQGKIANMNAVRIVTELNGRAIDDTGMTTARPFYQPVPIGHLAGRRFHAMRHTPMHDWHSEHGAEFVHAGDWYRAEYYRRSGGCREDAILSEARAVRESAGLVDISTLGKLFVNGPDAAAFLERIYTGRFTNLAVGRHRYAVALDESGIVIEDGLVARIAPDVFYVTATSSGVASFYREMQRWALIWGSNVSLINATGQLAAMNLAGPASREILSGLTDSDLSSGAFPYMGALEAEVLGVRVLLLRVGFVGELGFELHVPASQGMHVWNSILSAGESTGVGPFGLEAQRLLRLEKGHLIVGQDTDALTNLMESGLAWTVCRDKGFFIGKRSTEIIQKQPLERRLVGLRWPEGYAGVVPHECHLIVNDSTILGRITSIAPQSTLGYPIGLALLHPDHAGLGTELSVRVESGELVSATVVALPHYDPKNARQH
jgi:sarcosine oxidase subunit alpha